MKKYQTTKKPDLTSPLLQTADPELRQVLKQLDEMNGVGSHLPTSGDGLQAVRLNGAVLETFTGGKWVQVGSAPAPAPVSKPVTPVVANPIGADGSLYHSSLKGIGANDHHAAVTVSNTDTLDLTLTGQAVSGAVKKQMSIDADASGLKLSGDSATPGASKVYGTDGSGVKGWQPATAGSGDVVGPAGAVDGRIAVFDSTTGKLIKDGGQTIAEVLAAGGGSFDVEASNPQWLLEKNLEALLAGTLLTGNATEESITWTFSNSATANNSIPTWSGGWTSAAGYRSNTTAGSYVEFTIRTLGTHDIVLDRGATATNAKTACTILLDGAAQTDWNQATSRTYTLSAVAAGVHTVRVTFGGSGTTMYINTIQYYRPAYQGVGVAGDVAQILWGQGLIWTCTVGTGATDNGATFNEYLMGEAVTPRLPMGTALDDTGVNRDSGAVAGLTVAVGATGLTAFPVIAHMATTTARVLPKPGMSITLSATPGTRGFLCTSDVAATAISYGLSASISKLCFMACLVKITTAGAGSAFADGEVALAIIGQTTTSSNANGVTTLTTTSTGVAADLFKLP